MPKRLSPLLTIETIEQRILSIRGHRVMLDADLAEVYGVTTKRLNEQVKRNRTRFPEDFMFRFTAEEKAEVVANCDHLKKLKFSPALPYAFTEHGAVMLANVLNSGRAVAASIQVVRAFVRFRSILAAHKDLAKQITAMEKKYDAQFKVVFAAIKQLLEPPVPSKRRIGFHTEDK
jgi:hypothetical protein